MLAPAAAQMARSEAQSGAGTWGLERGRGLKTVPLLVLFWKGFSLYQTGLASVLVFFLLVPERFYIGFGATPRQSSDVFLWVHLVCLGQNDRA